MWANKALMRLAAWTAALVLLLLLGYGSGYTDGKRRYQAQTAKLQQDYAAQALAAERAYSAKLAEVQQMLQAQQDKTQAVGAALAEAQNRARSAAAQNKKGIEDAIKQDKAAAGGSCIDGFGASSLRQYRQALGYAD